MLNLLLCFILFYFIHNDLTHDDLWRNYGVTSIPQITRRPGTVHFAAAPAFFAGKPKETSHVP